MKIYKIGYELQVVSYDYCNKNNNDVIEPGDIVEINNIKIKNTGDMSLPNQEILLGI